MDDPIWGGHDDTLRVGQARVLLSERRIQSHTAIGRSSANPAYVHAYWSSPTHNFVPFLIGVKNKYDRCDLFKFAQSIPLSL
jgi:hypothetical protein